MQYNARGKININRISTKAAFLLLNGLCRAEHTRRSSSSRDGVHSPYLAKYPQLPTSRFMLYVAELVGELGRMKRCRCCGSVLDYRDVSAQVCPASYLSIRTSLLGLVLSSGGDISVDIPSRLGPNYCSCDRCAYPYCLDIHSPVYCSFHI